VNVDVFCVNNQEGVKDDTRGPITLDMEINDEKLSVELDTGSAVSIISKKDFEEPGLRTKMRDPGKKSSRYSHMIHLPQYVVMKHGHQRAKLPLYVEQLDGPPCF